jgi:hypothetical protein
VKSFAFRSGSHRRRRVAAGPAAGSAMDFASAATGRAVLLASAFYLAGCSFLLPTERSMTQQPWKSFAEAEQAFDRVVPKQTTVEDLAAMGLDPFTAQNIKVLTYLDLMARLMPHDGFQKSDMNDDVRKCLDAKDACRAFEVIVDIRHSKRTGYALLDILGFNRKTHITGWSFDGLLVIQDDVVVYKIRSGEPNLDRKEQRIKPLGPLQELDGLFGAAAQNAI